MWQRFTERARRVVLFAQEETARFGHYRIGTLFLLLGLIREDDTVSSRILGQLGVSREAVRQEAESCVQRESGNLGRDLEMTPECLRVIWFALMEAQLLNNIYVGTEHLLLGLLRQEGQATQVLQNAEVTLVAARNAAWALQQGNLPAAPKGEDALVAIYAALDPGLRARLAGKEGLRFEELPVKLQDYLRAYHAPQERSGSRIEPAALVRMKGCCEDGRWRIRWEIEVASREEGSVSSAAAPAS